MCMFKMIMCSIEVGARQVAKIVEQLLKSKATQAAKLLRRGAAMQSAAASRPISRPVRQNTVAVRHPAPLSAPVRIEAAAPVAALKAVPATVSSTVVPAGFSLPSINTHFILPISRLFVQNVTCLNECLKLKHISIKLVDIDAIVRCARIVPLQRTVMARST